MPELPSRRRPIRRLLQFRLRSLLLLVTVSALAMAFWLNAVQRERKAVARVEALGGRVRTEVRPAALRRVPLGRTMFSRVVGVDLDGTSVTDADLLGFEVFFHLRMLGLSQTRISGEGLRVVPSLGKLESLFLSQSPVRDASFEHVGRSRSIKRLDLYQTSVGDDGLRHLGALETLESLNLNETRVTDAGLEHLERLPNLQELQLNGTMVTDSGLACLRRLRRLRVLLLARTLITDRGLVHLRALHNLEDLSLSHTRVSDAGLEHLGELDRLRELELYGTAVSAEAAGRFALTRPRILLQHAEKTGRRLLVPVASRSNPEVP